MMAREPDAGQFSEKLLLLIPQTQTDALGGLSATEETTETLWARFDGAISAGTRESQQQPEARTLYRFVIRARRGIAVGSRLRWRGRSLQIGRVYAAPSPRLLMIEAEEGTLL